MRGNNRRRLYLCMRTAQQTDFSQFYCFIEHRKFISKWTHKAAALECVLNIYLYAASAKADVFSNPK
jgi:hypothetical protein